ncbi:transporter substrate-binding domain-containing protein [Desulfobacula sp.]|jgi:polar amino acid transport system substrate-binding protein|uniref:transporter substrate-binding domain-containing protein n=1 Tax=Desulfobacula sp. TaxID=2593537 RepID=UPI001D2A7FEC|nr:transporter substrate-binding domain-containing protein [Desulfobacula sp.]MBT3485979.1 transporter substrate-binding domain-containing protein [Desulfobacula sp.]MBT4025490.1 transporter substrate-binding domain-containing protein [Desulfobacula sp.]MBT4198889.1 transporter substrate-binding domain-containing protein [Desulfobacula sp.]MBT4506866.1 transporter substrate-binding domain-containing protein [Desulfobacula sp.]
MKKMFQIWAMISVVFLFFAGNAIAGKSALEEIYAAKTIVVSTDANYAPQSFLNDKGELEGFDVSVAKEVAKRLGVKVKFITPDWDLITAGKWGKRWDISIGSMTPTKERKNALLFTLPYYSSPAQFAIHKDNTDIKTLADLAGKRIGIAGETTNERYLQRDLSIEDVKIVYQDWKPGKLQTYPTDANHIEDLSLGDGLRLDAIFSSKQTIAEAIRSGCGKGCPMKMIGEPPYYEPLSFALDKSRANSQTLVDKLNEVIKSMNEDGTLVKLSEKFYGTNLIPKL